MYILSETNESKHSICGNPGLLGREFSTTLYSLYWDLEDALFKDYSILFMHLVLVAGIGGVH